MRQYCFFILLFCLHALSRLNVLDAQTTGTSPILYSLTEQNGLSDNIITCFYQDSKGFMWIGTEDGLNLYDGSAITVFKKSPDHPQAIADNKIFEVIEDSLHAIWIATANGLSRYEPQTGAMHNWRLGGVTNVTDFNYIKSLIPGKAGQLWLGTAAGLVLFDPVNNRFQIIPVIDQKTGMNDRANNAISKLMLDREGRFWLATYNGLWRFFPEDLHFEQYLSRHDLEPADDLVINMLEDHEGMLWVSVWNGGVKLFDPNTRSTQQFEAFKHLRDNVSGMAELRDPKGNYHLFFSPQLVEFSKQKNVLIDDLPSANESHRSMNIGSIYCSKDNLLWIATDAGVRILDPAKQVFQHHFLSAGAYSTQGIIVFQSSENLYIGGLNKNFLNLCDSNFQLQERLLPNFSLKEKGKKINPAMLHMVRENDQQIWLCTEKGLYLYSEEQRTGRIFQMDEKVNPSPTANFINRMLIDSKRVHWVFPWRNGIWQLDPVTGEFRKLFSGFMKDANGMKQLLIADAAEDQLGNLWFADLDEGVIYFDYANQKFSKPFDKIIGSRFSLQNILFENPFVWFVTEGRVYRVDASSKKWSDWSIPLAFNKPVTGFCSDHYDHLWITTINGLLCFDKSTHEFKRFSNSDGLLSNSLHGSIASLTNGKLVYAEDNYVTEFDPRELIPSVFNTPVMITGVYSQNHSMGSGSRSDGQKKMKLDYTNNDLRFRWALPSYSNPLQNQYYCKLDGVDKDWKYVGNKGESQYASLEPGSYLFRAEAAAGNGLMSKLPDSMLIVISPPFWRQWWFIISLALFIFSILYFLYRNRVQELIRMERLRSRISSDLHDDIGSTLSSISIISELALQENNAGSHALIREIKDNSQSLMEKMDDIVWSINPRNDSLEFLMLRVKQFASRLFEAKNIDYSIQIQDNIQQVKLPMEYRQHIYLILKESINNIVKYAQASHVSLHVLYFNSILEVRIKDNGKGFVKSKSMRGNGIMNMESRASLMHATLGIDSQPGEGTSINFRVKIK